MSRASDPHPFLERLRVYAASLPETAEQETWDHPTFRVRGKIFASFGSHDGRPSIGCKQTKADQALLVENQAFFVAPYVGRHGWIGIFVDDVEWDVVEELVERSYRLVAPRSLSKTLDEDD